MADELQYDDPDNPGVTLWYAVLETAGGFINATTGALVSLAAAATAANWRACVIPVSDAQLPGYYRGTVPTAVPAGFYAYQIREAAGTPATTALYNDPPVSGAGEINWGGSAADTAPLVTANIRGLTFRHKIDGVPTDLDDVPYLRDAANTYGVKRVDTGEIIVAAGTPFTRTGTGVYTVTFAGLQSGVEYLAYVEKTYLGSTQWEPVSWVTAAGEETYGSRAGVERRHGPDNVSSWADLNDNGDAAEISATIAQAELDAYNIINGYIGGAELTVPATVGNFAQYGVLSIIEDLIAGVLLYQSRGTNDEGSPDRFAGQMQGRWDLAISLLEKAIATQVAVDVDIVGPGEITFVPIERDFLPAALTDEFSSN